MDSNQAPAETGKVLRYRAVNIAPDLHAQLNERRKATGESLKNIAERYIRNGLADNGGGGNPHHVVDDAVSGDTHYVTSEDS